MKRVMKSITELVEEGWNKELLYRICHMTCSPAFRTSPNGKFYFYEDALIRFVSERRLGK